MEPQPRDGVEQVSLEELFERAKVICVGLKTVKEGHGPNVGIISSRLLERCDSTIIVNLANQALVDHDAMADAIEAGKIDGYTVEGSEDLRTSRLGHLEAVHFPPHNAWKSDESLATLRSTWVPNVVSASVGQSVNVYVD